MNASDIEQSASQIDWYPSLTNLGAEMYGAGAIWRLYGFYPRWLPLWIEATHSTCQHTIPSLRELGTLYSHTLVYVARYKVILDRYSSAIAHHVPCPYVLYRTLTGVDLVSNQKGTLAFYSHAVTLKDVHIDIDQYVDSLKSLPEKMQPVTVCLHYLDVQNGIHNKLLNHGIDCVTFGHPTNRKFIQNFYETVREYRYVISNGWTSALLYCADLGIPVSIIEPKAKYIRKKIKFTNASASRDWYQNTVDKCWPMFVEVLGAQLPSDLDKGSHVQLKMDEYMRVKMTDKNRQLVLMGLEIFSGLNYELSDDQSKFVAQELGSMAELSRFKLCWILYSSLVLTPIMLLLRILSNKTDRKFLLRIIIQKSKRDWFNIYGASSK